MGQVWWGLFSCVDRVGKGRRMTKGSRLGSSTRSAMHPAPPPCLLDKDITMSGETIDSKDAGRFEKLSRMAVLLLRAFSPDSKLDQSDKTERFLLLRFLGQYML